LIFLKNLLEIKLKKYMNIPLIKEKQYVKHFLHIKYQKDINFIRIIIKNWIIII